MNGPLDKTNLGVNVRIHLDHLRKTGLKSTLQWHSLLSRLWLRERMNRRHYQEVSESDLQTRPRSDTIFVFGSGYSLNEISQSDWQNIASHNTLGFTGFIYQNWIPADYHLIRAWVDLHPGGHKKWAANTRDYADTLNANPHFENTTLLLQGEYLAQFCNALVGHKMLRFGTEIFRYTTKRGSPLPSETLSQGLSHSVGTLCDAINFTYCLGWKHIVLVGVDLYDSRYFWLKADETQEFDEKTGLFKPGKQTIRGVHYNKPHNTTSNGMVETLGQWHQWFAERDVVLSVYNPRSWLTQVMPTYQIEPSAQSQTDL